MELMAGFPPDLTDIRGCSFVAYSPDVPGKCLACARGECLRRIAACSSYDIMRRIL
jgi:hypothetical protein